MSAAPVRVGFLGTARINDALLEGARLTHEVEVVAVASRDAARVEAYARKRGIARPHGSYESLLEDAGVEAVYVSLPNSLHHPWAMRALEAGKHVLCEKPYSRSPADVEEGFALAERSGLVLMEAFMWRHHPQTARLRELVEEGVIGELRLVRSAFSFPLTRMDDIRLDPALHGGALMDVGCYCVSAARLLAGEPESVTGQDVTTAIGVDVRFAGTMAFADADVLAHFDCGLDLPARGEIVAVGSDGELLVSDPWYVRSPGIDLRRLDGTVEHVPIEPANRYRLQWENLARAVRGEGPALLGRADALGQARAIDALYRAAASGEPVAV